MKYNLVSIDPSIISTAMCVNGKLFNYCKESKAVGKKGYTKWFNMCADKITLRFIDYREFDNYSDGELIKLKDYDKITDVIIKDILDNIDKNLPTKIGIEGFSYNSSGNSSFLFELISFSTVLRMKLFDKVSEDILVLSPSSLKLEACKLTYPPINEGKKKEKLVYRNNDGVAAGSLTKHGIFLCIVENDTFKEDWAMLCKTLKEEVMASSVVNKPIEDIDDCFILYKIIEKMYN